MHGHYRLHHSELVPGIFAKSAQITKLVQSLSPCVLCQKPFKRGHTCTVATQLAVLQLHCMDFQGNMLQCDLCDAAFASMAELHRHLGTIHELAIHDWNVARDSLASCDACSHCGQTFQSRDGLRNHIITGLCPSFNPLATNTPLNAAQKWEMLLTTGDHADGLTPHQRLQLTLHCQLCGELYSRAMDLSAHLQQSHGPLWTRSNEMVRFLLQTLTSRIGCRCNPSPNEDGQTHICNMIRQMAMIYYTSEQDLLVPWQFREAEVRHMHRALSSQPHFQMLVNALLDRDFCYLWHCPTLLKIFRNRCVVCGFWFHQLNSHHPECQWAAQIKFQLVQSMMPELTQDYQCNFCKLIYNVASTDPETDHERVALQRIHLSSNCPVVQQLTLTLLPIHGRLTSAGPVRHGAPSILCSAEPAHGTGEPIHQIKRRRTSEQKGQTRHSREQGDGRTTRTKGPHAAGEAHGSSGHPTRQGHSTAPPPGMLRFVRAVQPRQCPDSSDAADPRMEEDMGTGRGQSQTSQPSNVPSEGDDPGTAAAGGEVISEWPRSATLGYGSVGGCDPSHRSMAIPEMVPSVEEADHGTPETSGNAEGPQRHPVHAGLVGDEQSGPEVPWSEASSNCPAVAPAGQLEGTRSLVAPGVLVPVDPMVIDRSVTENALSEHEQASSSLGGHHQTSDGEERWQGQDEEDRLAPSLRSALRQIIIGLELDNTGYMCFANASITTFLWTTLSRQQFRLEDWGTSADVFQAMLTLTDAPIQIDQQPWYQEMVADWTVPAGQADSAEFTSLLMHWVAPTSVCCQWQRRWMQCENVMIHDQGARYQPITLQIIPSRATENMFRIQDLIRCWHMELGMQTALVRAPELLCIHIDRWYRDDHAGISKLTTPVLFTGLIQVPVFRHHGLDCDWESYQTVAVFAHHGIDNAGHYQALLRTTDNLQQVNRAGWLICDDCRKPQPSLGIPSNFHAGVTCLWLCRSDVMDLHQWPQPATDAVPATDTLLQMLAS